MKWLGDIWGCVINGIKEVCTDVGLVFSYYTTIHTSLDTTDNIFYASHIR